MFWGSVHFFPGTFWRRTTNCSEDQIPGTTMTKIKNKNKFNTKCINGVFLETRGFKDLEYDIGYHQYKDKVLWTPNVCYIIPDTAWSAIFKNHEGCQVSHPCEPRGHPMTYPPTCPLLAQGPLKMIIVKLKHPHIQSDHLGCVGWSQPGRTLPSTGQTRDNSQNKQVLLVPGWAMLNWD